MKYAIVINNIGHIQSKPFENSENSDEVLFGMKVELLRKEKHGWYYIRTHYNYEGYINKDELHIDDEDAVNYDNKKNYVCSKALCDILDKPCAEGHQIAEITRGAEIAATNKFSDDKKYIKVFLPFHNEYGWIRKSFLKPYIRKNEIKDENILRENIVCSALSYIGTQYRWGGKSPLGIDCSGLCQMSYMLNGINIYRDAHIKEGFPIKEIPIDKVKKGDLLFFKGHVAMYLGNNRYIHSATTNDVVKINSFNKDDDDYFGKLDGKILKCGSYF